MSVQRRITLTKEGDGWVALDEEVGESGVASQGKTREEALENLDEAVALHEGEIGESIETWEEEAAVLRDLGIDPETVRTARKNETIETPLWLNDA